MLLFERIFSLLSGFNCIWTAYRTDYEPLWWINGLSSHVRPFFPDPDRNRGAGSRRDQRWWWPSWPLIINGRVAGQRGAAQVFWMRKSSVFWMRKSSGSINSYDLSTGTTSRSTNFSSYLLILRILPVTPLYNRIFRLIKLKLPWTFTSYISAKNHFVNAVAQL